MKLRYLWHTCPATPTPSGLVGPEDLLILSAPMSHGHDRAKILSQLAHRTRRFHDNVPHNQALGVQVHDLGDGVACMSLDWRPDLVGNPETGVLHGGVVSALLDACCGAAVFQKLRSPQPIATLDLRIDYLRPATPKLSVNARAQCYRVTKNVAFVRAFAYHDDEDNPIAACTGSFILSTSPGQSRPPKAEDQDREA